MNWTIEEIKLPLKFTWAISRGSTDEKINYIINVADGNFKGRGAAQSREHKIKANQKFKQLLKDFY